MHAERWPEVTAEARQQGRKAQGALAAGALAGAVSLFGAQLLSASSARVSQVERRPPRPNAARRAASEQVPTHESFVVLVLSRLRCLC